MTEPGWYTDPRDSSQYRYWDGTSWTEAVAPGTAAESFAGGVEDQVADTSAVAESATDAATQAVSDHTDLASHQIDAVSDEFGAVSDQFDVAGSESAGGSVAAAFESAATAVPVDAASALTDGAASVREQAASALPVDPSPGLSVDEALLDLNPGDALESGPTFDGVGQGISVDDVLNDVETPFDEATETMVVDVPDFADAPPLGDVGIPGDGMSFSSPIDTFGPADQTAVISGADLPLADPETAQDADRFGVPPPSPNPGGYGAPGGALPPAPGFGPGHDQDLSGAGVVPPPGGFDGPPPDQFGQPGPGGPAFEPGAEPYGDQSAPRALAPPPAAPSRSRTPWIVLGVIGLAIVAVLAFLALRSPGRTSVDSIAEGQCFADFDQFEATEIRSSVSSADCLEAHALEVFEVTDDPYRDFAEYPGTQVITDLAFRHCLDGFEGFVGTTYEDSSLDVWALYPTEGSWSLNSDREVVCMVGAFDQTLTTGSLRGTGQ